MRNHKEYYQKHRERILKGAAYYRRSHGPKRWELHLKYKFGITVEDYNRLLEKQDHKCKICKAPAEAEARRLAVDHDHKNGYIRGLLCIRCNNGLGYFKDNVVLLKAALAYLEEHRYESLSSSCLNNSYK